MEGMLRRIFDLGTPVGSVFTFFAGAAFIGFFSFIVFIDFGFDFAAVGARHSGLTSRFTFFGGGADATAGRFNKAAALRRSNASSFSFTSRTFND
jgi:hypothetical protein